MIYAVKHTAVHGPELKSAFLLAVGVISGTAFVRRQRGLRAPLLDVSLFSNRSFSAALVVLLVGLIGVGGTMYLVTQYLQLVQGLTPFVAGLWMGPPALAMFAAAIGAPFVARRLRPGSVMALTLGLSVIGYVLLTIVGSGDGAWVVVAFAFVYLGLGAISALGTDVVVGSAPASKSGSAAAMSETVMELGIAVGVALLGSLTTALYAARMTAPPGTAPQVTDGLTGSLPEALALADELSADVLVRAQETFTSAMNVAAATAGSAIILATLLCLVALRHLPPLGQEQRVEADQR
ncbi:MFS transporter [Sanguibacter sp. Z1732]|uniref:MFS transporter n=1 Tax=Sanguibacter sp. Z1732 TaxID=3435412 RepID=UPI003D9C95CB